MALAEVSPSNVGMLLDVDLFVKAESPTALLSADEDDMVDLRK